MARREQTWTHQKEWCLRRLQPVTKAGSSSARFLDKPGFTEGVLKSCRSSDGRRRRAVVARLLPIPPWTRQGKGDRGAAGVQPNGGAGTGPEPGSSHNIHYVNYSRTPHNAEVAGRPRRMNWAPAGQSSQLPAAVPPLGSPVLTPHAGPCVAHPPRCGATREPVSSYRPNA